MHIHPQREREMVISEEKADLISSLPNEILQEIMSTLSMKEAVQLSSVSTAWRSLLTPSRLNLSSKHHLLSHIIPSLSHSAAAFQTLNLYLGGAPFAVCTKAPNGELHLDFSQSQHNLHQTFTLNIAASPSHLPFSRINTLHLRSVSRLVGETVALADLCSRVRSLRIEKCRGLESFEIQSSERLRDFEISDCPDIVKVSVSGQNIDSFSYKGVFTLLELHNLPNLGRATLDFSGGLGGNAFDCEDTLSLLSSLKDVEFLQLSTWLIEGLCCAGVIFKKLDFEFRRLKELKMICSHISTKTRDSFACFLHITPSLEDLELRMMEQGWSRVEYPLSQHQNWHEPHLWKDYATVKDEACRLRYMKKIRINGFNMERDEEVLVFMDLLLHIGINLKEMIVDDCWRLARVPYSQLSYIKTQYLFIPCPHHTHSYFLLFALSTPKF